MSITFVSVVAESTSLPSMAVMTSPAARPACCAGPRGTTSRTWAPWPCASDTENADERRLADVDLVRRRAGDDLVGDVDGLVDRDREALAGAAAAAPVRTGSQWTRPC